MSFGIGKKPWCQGSVFDRSGYSGCVNHGKYEEDGKRWCGHHLPSRVKAKDTARRRKAHDKWEANQARWARADRIAAAERDLVEGVLAKTHVRRGPGMPGWLLDLACKVRKARKS